jgi:hypothetical protein
MNRKRLILFGVVGTALLLSWPVSTRQGIDYRVTERRIPLLVKAVHFIDRSLAFQQLASDLTRGVRGDQAKAEAVLAWIDTLYRGVPEGLPVVDDHALHVAIRGYGTDDQLAELFAVVCGYAGLPATRLTLLASQSPRRRIDVAAVKIDGQWRFADPFRQIAPKEATGRWITIESLRADPAPAMEAAGDLMVRGISYERYLEVLEPVDEARGLTSWKQRPVLRVRFELQRLWQRVASGAQVQ